MSQVEDEASAPPSFYHRSQEEDCQFKIQHSVSASKVQGSRNPESCLKRSSYRLFNTTDSSQESKRGYTDCTHKAS